MQNSKLLETCCHHDVNTASQAVKSRVPQNSVTLLDVLERNNMLLAMKRVRANKGSPGSDNHTIDQTVDKLKTEWPMIKDQLLAGNYQPKPVKTVYIPKPNGRGQRMLGIPTVTDRLIQQAILQKISPIFDHTFSDNSYGFRPKRNAHQAVRQAHEHAKQGYLTAIDIDLDKFFDRVNHDKLMAKLAKVIKDKPLLRLIRKYLQNGMMEEGVITNRSSGTPQGSPLSPLLSNITLDELDKELEKRGHKFCRYADDLQIHVKSRKAGERVLKSLTQFIEAKLKLKVNTDKSKVSDISRSSILGYSFIGWKEPRIRCSNETIKRFKARIKQLTRGHKRERVENKIKDLDIFIRGWMGYFRLTQTKRKLEDLDSWIRTRLRMCQMKHWFFPRTRIRNMLNLGLKRDQALAYCKHKRWWFYAELHFTKFKLNNEYWSKCGHRGLIFYWNKYAKN